MDCPRIQENLSAWLDGELPAAEAEALRRHVEGCAACRQMAEELRSISTMLKNAGRRAAPADLADEVQSRLEREMLIPPVAEEPEIAARMDRRLAHEHRAWWPRVAAVAACVALVAAIAALWPNHHEKSAVSPPVETQHEVAMTVPAEASKKAEKLSDLASAGENDSLRDTRRRDEKLTETAPVIAALPEARPALEAELKNRTLGTGLATDKPIVASGPQVQSTLSAVQSENRLVLASDSDPAAAERELNEVLALAGIHTLTQQQAAPVRSMAKAAPAPPAPPAARAAAKSAHGTGVQPVETLVYTGTLNPVQLSNLNAQVAQNGTFTVAAKSNGAFAQMPVTQNSFRSRNNFQGGALNGGGQAQFKGAAANVRSGEQQAWGYNSNAVAVTGAPAPAGPGVGVGGGMTGGFVSGNAAALGLDKLKAENQAQVPVVIEVQARRQVAP